MNQKHLDQMNSMMSVIKQQNLIKEGEIKKIVDEKNKQIEVLKQTEEQKERHNSELFKRFEAEREEQARQMQSLVTQLAEQQAAIMARLSNMPARDAVQLEEEKAIARKIYEEQQLRRSVEKGKNPGATLTQAEQNKKNMETVAKVERAAIDGAAIEKAVAEEEMRATMQKSIPKKAPASAKQ